MNVYRTVNKEYLPNPIIIDSDIKTMLLVDWAASLAKIPFKGGMGPNYQLDLLVTKPRKSGLHFIG